MGTSVYTSLLIKDYKRKAGEIIALRKELREMARLIYTKEGELRALETVIRSREPNFDPQSVKPIATYPKVLNLKWTQLTKLILSCLREANGIPIGSAVIADYVIQKGGLEIKERAALMTTRLSVRKRLKGLAAGGKVVRHHGEHVNSDVAWTLPRGK